jgi:hypothetical protein
MRFFMSIVVGLVVVSGLQSTASSPAAANQLRLNGWFPCYRSKQSTLKTPAFGCAEVTVPLCHDGICKSFKTIDLFVKRLRAALRAPGSNTSSGSKKPKKKAMWILQGGSGYSSQASTLT